MNVGKSEVMRCSRYGTGGRMHVILNEDPLEEVDCFKYLGLQVAADGSKVKNKVNPSMARSLPVENQLPQNVGSIINYLQ